jgi:hypothetical protein
VGEIKHILDLVVTDRLAGLEEVALQQVQHLIQRQADLGTHQ